MLETKKEIFISSQMSHKSGIDENGTTGHQTKMRIGRIHTCYAVGILKFLFLFFVFCCCTKCQIRVEKMKRIFFCRKKEKPSLQAHTHQPDPITLYNWSNRRTDERMNRQTNRRTRASKQIEGRNMSVTHIEDIYAGFFFGKTKQDERKKEISNTVHLSICISLRRY